MLLPAIGAPLVRSDSSHSLLRSID